MRRGLRAIWVVSVVLACDLGRCCHAQTAGRRLSNPPVITGVVPPGGRAGEPVEWTLTGRGMTKVKRLLVSGKGVQVLYFSAKSDTQIVASVRIAPGADAGFREVRVEGADGISNLTLVRVDTIPQVREVEPNDEPAGAQAISVGTAVAGVVRETDVDHYRVEGTPGDVVTVDLEAHRLGTAITPVLTVLNRKGTAIAQARESRSSDHDCRLPIKVPADGVFFVQIRDNTYGGNESSAYRLRVTKTPFATGLFPLGGPRGKSLTVTVGGGNLRTPIARTVTLPDTPGVSIDPGPFETPDGPVASPGRLVVGDDREIAESFPGAGDGAKIPIQIGQTASGLIGRKGEVDRYAMTVKKGDKFRIRVVAEPLGSWLDSVLTVRDKAGEALAENDDEASNAAGRNQRGVNSLGLAGSTSDSLIDYEAAADGPISIEVTDRYGDGGIEFGYRLSIGVTRPDFTLTMLLGNPNGNGEMVIGAFNQSVRVSPGTFGVFNIAPGAKIPVNFVVSPEGRPGPVTVTAEGLPEGVTAEPVKLDILGPGDVGGQPAVKDAPAKAENLVLSVAPYAEPGLGQVRFVATAEPSPGVKLRRVGTATIGLNSAVASISARPNMRQIDAFPLRVVGEPRPRFVGPPEEPRLIAVHALSPLLQGDRIDLGLDFDISPLSDPGFSFEAVAKGVGLATNTVISSGSTAGETEEAPGDVRVRVLASPKAVPGVYPVWVTHAMTGGKPTVDEAFVVVRPPVEVLCRAESISVGPGSSAEIWVGIRREPGAAEVEVDLKLEGLPRGVKMADANTLKAGEAEAVLKIEMAANARPLAKPTAVRVVAISRMPRGAVTTESRIRPMLVAAPSEGIGRGRIE